MENLSSLSNLVRMRNNTYRGRSEKMELLVSLFRDYLDGEVLDLGCAQGFLRERIQDYIGLDTYGAADVKANLEDAIPFKDNSFDCVICFGTLEHLEEIHKAFDEACRVSRKYFIVELPNLYCIDFRLRFLLGRTIGGKYGLTVEKPIDRHRWLFTLPEAIQFIRKKGEKNHFSTICENFVFYRYLRFIPRLVSYLGRMISPNMFAWGYWVVLERTEPANK
jgi:SAM-dependent methyltransferase